MDAVPEIRREKVIIPPDMTREEIKEQYGLSTKQAGDALKSGFFVKIEALAKIGPTPGR